MKDEGRLLPLGFVQVESNCISHATPKDDGSVALDMVYALRLSNMRQDQADAIRENPEEFKRIIVDQICERIGAFAARN